MDLTTLDTNMIVAALGSVAVALLGAWKFYSTNKLLIDLGTKALSAAVTEVSKRTDNKVDDVFAAFLRNMTGQLEAKGKAPISEAKARAVFDKLQGVK